MLVHESLYLLLGGDNEEPSSWSPLSFLSRVYLLQKTVRDMENAATSNKIPSPSPYSCLIQCAYTWPWVAVKQREDLLVHNVAAFRFVKLQSGPFPTLY